MRYAWINDLRGFWPITRMCVALKVSRSGFYSWTTRSPSVRERRQERLDELVSQSHAASYRIYGYRKIHRDIVDNDLEDCCAETVRRAMQRLGIRSRRARKFVVTTDSNHDMLVAENLLDRDFSASAPNEKWLADITYLATEEGWLYLAVVLDCYSRFIAGWSMSDRIDSDLVCSALRMALMRRKVSSSCRLIHHSDRGQPICL
ncbi:MAG: IS3 family transposase [Candidatus Aegiribacteria sp.]|nr:IS3 family transposase [Candidatus Aegiribacteria sp.]